MMFLAGVMLVLLSVAHSGTAMAAAATPGSISVANDRITYFARNGDTLASIARKLTLSPDTWVELARLNEITHDARIPVGSAIMIPATLLQDTRTEGRIVASSGIVVVTTANGRKVPAAPGVTVGEGAQVETAQNSFLTIAFTDDSRLSIPSNSRAILSKLRTTHYTNSPRTEIRLLRGRAESRVAPLRHKGGSYDVRTPLSVAGVRGTHFRVGVNGNVVTNEVISGTVDVTPTRGGAPVRLYSGMGNTVRADRMSGPAGLPAAPALHRLTPQPADAAVTLAMGPLRGASSYHVQITRDGDAQDIVTEAYAAGEHIRVGGLAKGDYYAHVSAISPDGLEGGTQMHAFRLGTTVAPPIAPSGATPNPPGPPKIELAQDKRLLLKWPGMPGYTYQVQVARDPAFSWLLANKAAPEPQLLLSRPSFGTYYARVQAIANDGAASPFSLAQGFVVTDHWVIHEGEPAAVSAQARRATD